MNLYLEVVGRRPDGFHELVTLFLALPWGDDVAVEAGEDAGAPGEVALVVRGDPSVPRDGTNLAHRAARAYLDAAAARGVRAAARVTLEKRVPAGGGLGGGSSDAAAVLRLLQASLGALPEGDLLPLARGLGADVPFFLHGGLAVGRGRGDAVEPLPAPPRVPVLLLLPPLATRTASVFAAFRPGAVAPPRDGLARAVAAARAGDPRAMREAHFNHLARPAFETVPALAAFAREAEARLGRTPCLSGSGAALFDLPSPGEEEAALARLEGLPGRRLLLRG